MDSTRYNGEGPTLLEAENARKLWNHIRALEALEEQKAEVAEDIKCRKEIVKADGFDTNIIGVILKRRKAGEGMTLAADNLLSLYETALRDQGALPLEQTRRPREAEERPSIAEVSVKLHGIQALSEDDAVVIPAKDDEDPEIARVRQQLRDAERAGHDPF